jgi:hypothetical protein
MIGFDRPLRPEWIYHTLKLIKPGTKPGIYKLPFEAVAKELIGKEGKRKVKTIIFRSFIYSMQEKTGVVADNLWLHWVSRHSLAELKPLFLAKIMMDYEITRNVIKKMCLILQPDRTFAAALLSKQMVRIYGDRDVVKRSVNSFLATMAHFGVIVKDDSRYRLVGPASLSDTQSLLFLILYSKSYFHTELIDLDAIDEVFIRLFDLANRYGVAKKFHGEQWEYIRDHGRNVILFKDIGIKIVTLDNESI